MNQDIFFNCPHCQTHLKLPHDVASPGEIIECPKCGKDIQVPKAETFNQSLQQKTQKSPKKILHFTVSGIIVLFVLFLMVYGITARMSNLKKQRYISASNQEVLELISQAERFVKRGDFQKASQKISEAKSNQYANNLRLIRFVEAKLNNAKSNAKIAEAISAAKKGDIEKAKIEINKAIEFPRTSSRKLANQLRTQLEIASDPKQIEKILLNVSDSEFDRLLNTGNMPQELVFGYKGTDNHIKEYVQSNLPQITEKRKEKMEFKVSNNTTTSEWYQGGTLQEATFKTWSQASYANRLATTADFVFKVFEAQGQKKPSIDTVKPLAEFMEKEISSYCTKVSGDKFVFEYVAELVIYMQLNN